ncbi:hypothetical protein EGW08_017483 [Elysia chlorotica]|uniref:Uncharacterized protein n=1 Tax=Elysia chlorotica TaxID=188477 RepID=A0A433SZM0_ELYCH|nr:hypothetical protein EGW08_017483 [Elysia chlorotica]
MQPNKIMYIDLADPLPKSYAPKKVPLKARQIHKRQHHDPWNLCPREMNSGDCFYVYLKVYAQLRQNGSQQGPDRIMVGKRSQAESMWSARSHRTGRPQVRDLSDFPGLLDSLVRGQV